jgi:hypothetical protein
MRIIDALLVILLIVAIIAIIDIYPHLKGFLRSSRDIPRHLEDGKPCGCAEQKEVASEAV